MQSPIQNSNSVSDRVLNWLETTLRERRNPDSTFQKICRNFRGGVTAATVAYFLGLTALLLLLNWRGERNWFLSILLFIPPVIWLVPLVLLTPIHIMVRPKLCWISVAAVLVVGFVYLDFNWAFPVNGSKAGLKLLTNNTGGREFDTLEKFIEHEKPDVIALQDTYRLGNLAKKYPERFVARQMEFILVSKTPIRQSGLLTKLRYRGHPIGAWYELQYEGQPIVVYNIHMPTPRPEFLKLRGYGFIMESVHGKGIYSSEVRKEYREYLKQRIELAQGLVEFLQKEKRPFLVAGDFNMPGNGYISSLFRSQFLDAFVEKGRGYGFTFPGATGGVLNIFGSWLRLDYLFADKNWRVVWCRVEPRNSAEHSAVVARFELKRKQIKP
jgi:endonuclease/exonuclease/phosphatase (EEP) superfamily protein YafD